jgi:hypothetical protein
MRVSSWISKFPHLHWPAAKDKKMRVALARSHRQKVARGNGLAQFLITWI